MTRSILCATDFSDSSKQAIAWTVSMARQIGAKIIILHTYRLLRSLNGEAVKLKKKMEEEARKNFEVVEKEFLINQGISYDFKTEVGFVIDRVEDYAKNGSIRFLVMDKNMSTSNKEMFNDLLEHLKVPLVIVP
jgi:nucleotide-binding universal stress UspA family protein